jgi:hypothetical protein
MRHLNLSDDMVLENKYIDILLLLLLGSKYMKSLIQSYGLTTCENITLQLLYEEKITHKHFCVNQLILIIIDKIRFIYVSTINTVTDSNIVALKRTISSVKYPLYIGDIYYKSEIVTHAMMTCLKESEKICHIEYIPVKNLFV